MVSVFDMVGVFGGCSQGEKVLRFKNTPSPWSIYNECSLKGCHYAFTQQRYQALQFV